MFLYFITDRGCVQLGPKDVHSCFSSSFRVSCSREMAELVMAGLDTAAPMAGPPVVFTICNTPRSHGITDNALRCVNMACNDRASKWK